MDEAIFIDLILVNILYFLDNDSLLGAKLVHPFWLSTIKKYERYLDESNWVSYNQRLSINKETPFSKSEWDSVFYPVAFCTKTGLSMKVDYVDSSLNLMIKSSFKIQRQVKIPVSGLTTNITITKINLVYLPKIMCTDCNRHFIMIIEGIPHDGTFKINFLAIDYTNVNDIRYQNLWYDNALNALVNCSFFNTTLKEFVLSINKNEWSVYSSESCCILGVIKWDRIKFKTLFCSFDQLLNIPFDADNVDFFCNRFAIILTESSHIKILDTWNNCDTLLEVNNNDDNLIYYCHSLELSQHHVITLWGQKTKEKGLLYQFFYYIFDLKNNRCLKRLKQPETLSGSSDLIYRSFAGKVSDDIVKIAHLPNDAFINTTSIIDFDLNTLQFVNCINVKSVNDIF